MVDLHSHILHGLDDGARTVEESVEMVRLAVSCGTTDIVCTPHSNHEYVYNPALVAQRIEDLERLTENSLRIHSGCDLHLSYNNIRDACENTHKYSVNGGSYLLVEFSDYLNIGSAYAMLGELQNAGLQPIVTHPERNPVIAEHLDELAAWVDRGCFVQITALSLLGGFGGRVRRCCQALIQSGLVHFVSSDGHDVIHRPPRLDLAKTWLQDNYGDEYADLLVNLNPANVINDRPISSGAQRPPEAPKRWYQFWRNGARA
jgi:protein-tyrosine phosphatase